MYVANLVAVLWRERQKLVSEHVEEKASSAVPFCKKAVKGFPRINSWIPLLVEKSTTLRWLVLLESAMWGTSAMLQVLSSVPSTTQHLENFAMIL